MPRALPGVRTFLPFVAIAAVYAVAITILRSSMLAAQPEVLSAAIAFDLTVTTPLFVWWLGVRRAGWPRWTVGIAFAVGLFVGRTALPHSFVVTALIAGWLAAEAAIVVLAVTRIRRIVRVARAHAGPGPIAKVEAGLVAAGAPARFAVIASTDAVAVWHGITGWFRRAPRDGLAMHRRKSWTAIVMVLLFLIAVETAALHLFVAHWSPIAAWILTALSIYSALWIAGDLHLLRLHPLRVTPAAVVASIGLRWRCVIPRDSIAAVEVVDAVPEGALNASIVEPTVVIRLTAPLEVRGLFGIRRTPTAIALTVDEPERLLALLALVAPRA